MSITIITTTRDRPEAFALLEKWIARQTVQPDQWLVVNDSENPDAYSYNCGQDVVIRERTPGERHSLCENWLAALEFAKGQRIIVCEDDDWYGEKYVETVDKLLDGTIKIAGVKEDLYYHVPARRFIRMHNQTYCSLACRAFRRMVFSHLRRLVKAGDPMFDIKLWEIKFMRRIIPNGQPPLHVGMKGSRTQGIGKGHNPSGWSTDGGFHILRDWIGNDAKVYMDIATKSQPW